MACSDINRITHDMLYRLNLSDLFFFLISNKISQTSLGMRNIVATHRSTYTMCINFATTAVCRVILHLYVCVCEGARVRALVYMYFVCERAGLAEKMYYINKCHELALCMRLWSRSAPEIPSIPEILALTCCAYG